MSETDYRESKKLQDNVGKCLDANSDEYVSMEDTQEMYEEVQQRDYEVNDSCGLQKQDRSVSQFTINVPPSQTKKSEAENVYSDPKCEKKIKWTFPYTKHYLGEALYAAISLTALVLVVILVIAILVKIGSLQSSVSHSSCEKSLTSDSDFVKAFQQQLTGYCELEKKKFMKYQISDADFASCSDVRHHNPSAESGYYLLRSSTGQLTSVFCDMAKICGNITGGWMRVAELDVASCPTGLKSKLFQGIQTCVVNEDGPGCTSVQFSSFGIPFSKICGQIRGYGVGSVDGMHDRMLPGEFNISDNYLDGVSLTTGGTHIWSFSAGGCVGLRIPSFITNDFTCDGHQCSSGNFCGHYLWNDSLSGETTPFLKHLPDATLNEINMRVCRDELRDNEDIALSNIELYVH